MDNFIYIADDFFFLCIGLLLLYLFILAVASHFKHSNYPKARKQYQCAILVPYGSLLPSIYQQEAYEFITYKDLLEAIDSLDKERYELVILLSDKASALSPHFLEKIYNNPTQNPRVAISFSVPIFDWGEKKARVKAQEVAQKINRLEFHEDKVNIELNIRQTWRNLENLLSQIKIAKQNVANAQRTYDLNLTRYREGDITGMDMNQFQTQLSNKKIAYTQALINYKIELLNLKILSLYDFEHDVPIVPMEDLVTKK